MTENPFEVIEKRLSGIEALLIELKHTPTAKEPAPDRITLQEACEFTNLSKSQFYKMTMLGTIPCSHFGKRLVFSRKELTDWMEEKTISTTSAGDEMSANLTDAAKKRLAKR